MCVVHIDCKAMRKLNDEYNVKIDINRNAQREGSFGVVFCILLGRTENIACHRVCCIAAPPDPNIYTP